MIFEQSEIEDKNPKANPLSKKATEIITLRQLFSDNHVFRIPDYQRGYAWGEEFVEMWKDIKRLHKTNNRKHYTGMIALEEIIDEQKKEEEAIADTTAFYVVDGQQRITSLVIILNSLIKYVTEELPNQDISELNNLLVINDVIYRFDYSCKRQDDASQFFEDRVFNNNTSLPASDMYQVNLNKAKTFIDRECDKLSGEEAWMLLNDILDRIVFNLYFVTDDFDVRVTFETINNRGKRLSKLELLKNRLMYLSTFFPRGEKDQRGQDLKKRINTSWQNIYKNLCLKDTMLSDDDYLKAHWIVYGRLNKRKGDAYIDDLLGEQFSIDSGRFFKFISEHDYSAAYKHIRDYIDSLSKYSLYWAFVNRPEDVSINLQSDEIDWIKRLSRISNVMYLRAALMVVSAEATLVTAEKIKYYSKVEQFIFVNKLLAQDKNDLSFLVTPIRALFDASKSKAQTLQKMVSDIENHDLKVDAARVKTAVDAFRLNVLEKKKNYYYDWNGLSYFLYEYNDSLQVQNAAPIAWYELSSTSIEHVYPQTPVSDYWKIAFGKYNDDEKRVIVNSLGNLLLLSNGAENSSLKNYSYPVKRDMSVSSMKFAYSHGSRSARAIAEKECWTITEVSERTDALIQFMFDHWFSGIPEFIRADWDECADILRNRLPSAPAAGSAEHNGLKTQLAQVDTSGERAKAESAVMEKTPENYLERQFLGYINTDDISVKYNVRRNSYKDWFSFYIESKAGNPVKLKCGVKIDGTDYTIHYEYSTNELDVSYWDAINRKSVYYLDGINLPQIIQQFIRSLFRYLGKVFAKPKPTWIDRSKIQR